ncbi:MAG: hypothetical protein WEH44_08545 [Pirellulaceae bacterium]
MTQWVEIVFDCLPLRSIGRLDIPIDASPKFRQRCERIKQAMEKHGSHNSYFLYGASCKFHLTNKPDHGTVEFRFEGTVLTDASDLTTQTADLEVELVRETCDWLTAPVVAWFAQSVSEAVKIEFDRYIEAGDLTRAKERAARMQAEMEKSGGYVGMYL